MLTARQFKWLPNALTASRMVLSVPIFLAALHESWGLAFWLLTVALVTDFLDGLAAKKLNAKSDFGAQLDPLADSSLVVAGMVGLSATGYLSWWFTGAVFLFGLTVGNDRLWRAKTDRGLAIQKVASVICLFLAWTGIVWFFASLAFGWTWLYVPITVLVLLLSASLKRHRIRAWLGPLSGLVRRRSK